MINSLDIESGSKVALPSCYPHKDSLMLLFASAAKLPP